MRTQLVVEENVVDLTDELSALLTFAIDDVTDFSSRNTAYSKTINIPGTAQNNFIFGHIFSIDVYNTHNPAAQNVGFNYNAGKSAKCEVLVDYMILFKGVIRVLEVKINDGFIEYECSLVGELGGLAYAIEGKKLEDLDFSAYDDDYTILNMQMSWAAAPGLGIYYPLIDYGLVSTNKIDYQFQAFRPALYVKEYLDKIFTDAGYTYESEFINGNYFKRLIIPNNQEFFSFSYPIISDVTAGAGGQNLLLNPIPFFTTVFTNHLTQSASGDELISNRSNEFSVQATTQLTYTVINPTASPITYSIWIEVTTTTIQKIEVFETVPAGFSGIKTTDITGLVNITLNSTITVRTGMFLTGISSSILSGGTLVLAGVNGALVPIAVNLNDPISTNLSIPKEVTQKDFIISLVKMFNLYIYEDRDKNKHLKIEPYINFYDTLQLLDWTNKIDYSKQVSIKPLSEINSRKYEYKFKDDSDYYNEQYKKKFGTAYGNRIYDTTYEFVKDTKSVEVIFAPTPLVQYGGTEKILPVIYKKDTDGTESKIASKIRILCRSTDLVDGTVNWKILNGATVLWTSFDYPYAGHLDDPKTPLLDLNFGSPSEFYFTFTGGFLQFNLFNVYWSAYMAEIANKDSKLLTAHARLTSADIQNLDFAKYIFVGGQLFRLNKVEDYNVADENVTKVELLNVIDIDFNMGDIVITPGIGEFNDDFNGDFNI